jgi:hypothetical protein
MNSLIKRNTINPQICHGKITIKNLLYFLKLTSEVLSSLMTTLKIVGDCSDLEGDDIKVQ